MDTLEAIKAVQSLGTGTELLILSDFSGHVKRDGRLAITFYSEQAFRSRVADMMQQEVAKVNRAKFKDGVRVMVSDDAPAQYAGKSGKVEAYDSSDNTAYVRGTNGAILGWISSEKLTVTPFVVKDSVRINEGEYADEEGIVVQIDESDEPYLVYVPSADETFWFAADDFELVS